MNEKKHDASSDSFEQAASDVADSRSVDWRNLEESGVVDRDELDALRRIEKLHSDQRQLAQHESSSTSFAAPRRGHETRSAAAAAAASTGAPAGARPSFLRRLFGRLFGS